MENIFSLPYSEYEVIVELQKKLTKKDGNAFYIPTSRQQKGIDFIIHNNKTNKLLRIQVKSSRSYIDKPKKLKSGKIKEPKFRYNLWFNNFIERYQEDNADYYILFGLYPQYKATKNIKSKNAFWNSIILCFSEKEMIEFLEEVKTKKEQKTDRFFGIAFNDPKELYATRGFIEDKDVSDYFLKNRLEELKEQLNIL